MNQSLEKGYSFWINNRLHVVVDTSGSMITLVAEDSSGGLTTKYRRPSALRYVEPAESVDQSRIDEHIAYFGINH